MSSGWLWKQFFNFQGRYRGGIDQSYRKKLSYGTPLGVPPPLPWCLRLDIDKLQEYNDLKHENHMNVFPKPFIVASITASASENHHLQSVKKEIHN